MSNVLPSAEWDGAKHILCVRLDAMGDVLMTEPALRAVAHSKPGRKLTLLTSSNGSEAARLIPYLHDVIVYEAPWMKSAPTRRSAADHLAIVQCLQDRRFDAALIFTVYTQSALPAAVLCTLADIPLRAAYCRENPYHLLTNWIPETEPEIRLRHEVQRQLDLAASIGCPAADDRISISISAAAFHAVDRFLSERIRPSKRWVVVHPGGTAESRRYPVDGFAAVARGLVRSLGCEILWTGSRNETALIAQAQRAMNAPSHSLAGQLNLEEFAALIARAPLLISNNTSAVHLASAVCTPVVDLYALTNPQHTPWRVPCRVLFEDVPCRFCYKSVCPEGHHRCLQGVSPEVVVSAAVDLFAQTSSGSRMPSEGRDETTCLFQDNMRASARSRGS
ncbi:MAG TPA: glycosyltransferase family 9 protein [Nitrospira sp.]|nr:glycosyltransferase family 9 protein [Nitrospira sp.]